MGETKEELKYRSKMMQEYMAPFETMDISKGLKIELDGVTTAPLGVEESIGISEDIYNIAKTQGIEELTLKNIHISSNPELPIMLKEVGKNVKKFKIENCEIGNLEHLMQGISGKEEAENIFLRAKLGITDLEYDKEEKKLGISADRTSLIKDFSEYLEPDIIDILVKKEEDKIKLAQNIDEIREIKTKKIKVKDATSKKNITAIDKYEQYVNGHVVLLHSKILKESMGIDRLPAKNKVSYSFQVNVEGQKFTQDGKYKIEDTEIEAFIQDLKELSTYSNISRISFKNVEIPNNTRLKNALQKILGQVNWIAVENSLIPALPLLISRIADKSELERLIIRNCGIKLEDLDDIQKFSNLSYISVGEDAEQLVTTEQKEDWLIGEENESVWGKVKNFIMRFPILKRLMPKTSS